ncbi:hypothetical protein FOZ60_002062 [Perkinsus olseni]|uniref:TLC domain-containing protein n=1 Tax=Perkinsus olseni TaxID=32597 RepID=A0A7J6P1D3_PEROL|nr:hypothetical protein FOZ60_002062 [Perkinsus olseni]
MPSSTTFGAPRLLSTPEEEWSPGRGGLERQRDKRKLRESTHPHEPLSASFRVDLLRCSLERSSACPQLSIFGLPLPLMEPSSSFSPPMSVLNRPSSVLIPFSIFATVFILNMYRTGGCLVKSCEYTSMFHHSISIAAALACMAAEWNELSTRAVYGSNTDFPWASLLQHINIGYFLYDFLHSLAWEHHFIIHHAVALTGLFASEYMNSFALANAVNTLIAESGSIIYNYYNAHKSLNHYFIFVAVYGSGDPSKGQSTPSGLPYAITSLQLSLLVVNLVFLFTHMRKLNRKLRERRQEAARKAAGEGEVTTAVLRRRSVVAIDAAAANMGEA